MTVDWDEELRKLNASQYGKRQERDLTKDMNDPEAVKWARKNAKIAQSAMENSTKQVIDDGERVKTATRRNVPSVEMKRDSGNGRLPPFRCGVCLWMVPLSSGGRFR